jgi:hypothetical protein
MNPVESSGAVKSTPAVANADKAPTIATEKVQIAEVVKSKKEATRVNPNDKKYQVYGNYDKKGSESTAEQDAKQFRTTMAAYLARSQSLINNGDSKAAAEHIEKLMEGFTFEDDSEVVVEMYRLLDYVSRNIRLNGLENDQTKNSLGGIIRNLKEGFQ